MTRRTDKMAELVKKNVSEILQHDIDELANLFITVTTVRVPSDFKNITIFYSVIGGDDEKKGSARLLDKFKNRIRFELGKKIPFRFVPDFIFEYDDTLEKAANIEKILKDMGK